MKKRIISLLMTFCMAVSFIPTSLAAAAHENQTIQERSSVPVYVYAETVYDGGIYKGAVEGLKRNGSGWVTIDIPKISK